MQIEYLVIVVLILFDVKWHCWRNSATNDEGYPRLMSKEHPGILHLPCAHHLLDSDQGQSTFPVTLTL
jgi:hypothetical protein